MRRHHRPRLRPRDGRRAQQEEDRRFLILEADEAFTPPPRESREVLGVRLTHDRDQTPLSADLLEVVTGPPLTERAVSDLLLGMAVLRWTQSNSVCYVRDGVTLGIGAGQQSRVDCTRLAGAKVDTWWLRRHPAIRDLAFAPGLTRQDKVNWQVRLIEADLTPSDGHLPFRDNVDQARRHGVTAIAEPGGSIRSDDVAAACEKYGITLVRTGLRLFHH